MKGSTYKRCRCRDENGKEYGTKCPKLRRGDGSYSPTHGRWYFKLELDADETGKRRFVRRGGFDSLKEAEAELDEARKRAGKGVDVSKRHTTETYLREWLDGLAGLARNTRRSYGQHCETLWIPQVGKIEPTQLRRKHVQDALDTLDKSAATKQRYRATLRAALNDAMRDGIVDMNAAKLAKIESGKRPKARVWTAARVLQFEAELETRLAVARSKARGQRISEFKTWRDVDLRPSPVMVWTPNQVGRFLDHIEDHRWYALYHLIAYRGLRRGEAVGLRREDLDLESGVVTVGWQITKGGGVVDESSPKTDDSDADVILDSGTVKVLRQHLQLQAEHRIRIGDLWRETEFVFTGEDGARLDPDAVTEEFLRQSFDAGCPPIRLHDLRHSAASVMHAAGVDRKVISKTLRHSTTAITDDTYTSVFLDVDREAADASAAAVPRRSRRRA